MKRWMVLLLSVLLLAPAALAQEEELPAGASRYVAQVENDVMDTLEVRFVRSADGTEMSQLQVMMASPKEGSGVELTLNGMSLSDLTITFPFTAPIEEGRLVVDDTGRAIYMDLQVADTCAWGSLEYANPGPDGKVLVSGAWNVLFLNETNPGDLSEEAVTWMTERAMPVPTPM